LDYISQLEYSEVQVKLLLQSPQSKNRAKQENAGESRRKQEKAGESRRKQKKAGESRRKQRQATEAGKERVQAGANALPTFKLGEKEQAGEYGDKQG